MKNKTLINLGREVLKVYLEQCTSGEIMMFRRMYCPNNLDKHIEDVVTELDPSKIDHAITQCENTLKKNNRPYIVTIEDIKTKYGYNKDYGDDKECVCGHPYYRHFDTYEDMYPIGCKYCQCFRFEEITDENREEINNKKLSYSRFEVIDKYPNSVWEIGDIIDCQDDMFLVKELEEYPKFYKKLNWYEKRNENEMPKYLKFIWEDELQDVVKVTTWLYDDTYTEEKNKTGEPNGFRHESHNTNAFPRVSLNGWTPATENEYKQFIKQQNYEK